MALAGALFAGGTAYSLVGADGALPTPAPVKLTPPAGERAAAPKPSLLTLTAIAPTPAPAPPGAEPRAAPAAPAVRAERPRRDLAGFLDQQGLPFTPLGGTGIAPQAEDGPIAVLEVEPAVALAGATASDPVELAPAAPAPLASAAPTPLDPGAPPSSAAITQSFPMVTVHGATLGAVTMRGETVHLGGLLGLLQLKMPAEEFARLAAAPAADSFVSLATLRAAGLAVSVDAKGEQLTLAAI